VVIFSLMKRGFEPIRGSPRKMTRKAREYLSALTPGWGGGITS